MRRQYKLLTPRKAWERYGNGVSVEYFITDFIYEGYTDLWEMCKKYILDIINSVDGLVTIEERTRVTKFFYQYIKNYVDCKGGMDKLKLLNPAELDIIWNDEIESLLKDLRQLEKNYGK